MTATQLGILLVTGVACSVVYDLLQELSGLSGGFGAQLAADVLSGAVLSGALFWLITGLFQTPLRGVHICALLGSALLWHVTCAGVFRRGLRAVFFGIAAVLGAPVRLLRRRNRRKNEMKKKKPKKDFHFPGRWYKINSTKHR